MDISKTSLFRGIDWSLRQASRLLSNRFDKAKKVKEQPFVIELSTCIDRKRCFLVLVCILNFVGLLPHRMGVYTSDQP